MIMITRYFAAGIVFCLLTACSVVLSAQTKESAEPVKQAPEQELADDTAADPPAESAAESRGWSLFRGDPGSTGVAPSGLPDELDVLWKFEVPQGAFEGSAAIVAQHQNPANKRVYIADLDGKVFAFDLETGEKQWEFQSEIGFVTSPAVKEGRIYIGDIDGVFYCLGEDGKEIWRFQTQAEINSSANFYEDNVLVGSQDANLYAINSKTGKVAWTYESQDQIRCSATVAGNRAFVAGCDGFFHVVNLDNGEEVGNTDIRSPTGATPAALGDRVFFGNEQGDFFAVDWKQVKNEWVYGEGKELTSIRSCAAVKDDQVIFAARNRTVYSLHPQTGKENWTLRLKGKVDSSPVIVGDRVFVAASDGRLSAISLKDGKKVWEKEFNGGFISSPTVAFGRLVVATDRGVVYCLGKKTDQ